MSMRIWTRVVLAAGAALCLAPAGAASAELSGPCTATGVFQTGVGDEPITVDATTIGEEVVTVALSDTVAWTGTVTPTATPREYSGKVAVDLPWPLGAYTVDSWRGSSDAVANEGLEEYDLPSVMPRGVVFRVEGSHSEPGVSCVGHVNLQVEGSVFKSPLTLASLALTALAGAGLAAVVAPAFGRVR